jgi:superfamily II DNA or RNA helicase
MVLKILTFDTARNALIADDIISEAKAGKKCLVLSERKEHVELLNTYLKRDFETLVFTADFSKAEQQKKEKQLHSGHFHVVIATGQLFGEGVDVQGFDCLFLVFPFSFEGKLVQYIGRIERGELGVKRVYDYRDLHITQLESMFKKRQRHYNRRKRRQK